MATVPASMSTQLQSSQHVQRRGKKQVRALSAEALAILGWRSRRVELQLVETLKDPDEEYAGIDAAKVLGTFGEHSTLALDVLSTYLRKGKKIRVREACAAALGSMGKHAASAACIFAEVLNDGNPAIRRTAAQKIGSLGQHASSAILDILKLLTHGDTYAKISAAQALASLGKKRIPRDSMLRTSSQQPNKDGSCSICDSARRHCKTRSFSIRISRISAGR